MSIQDQSEEYKLGRIKANLELASVHLGNVWLYVDQDSPNEVGAIKTELSYIQGKLEEYINILQSNLGHTSRE